MKKLAIKDIVPFNFYRVYQQKGPSMLILVVRGPHPDDVEDREKRFDFINWDLESSRQKSNLSQKVISRFCREAGLLSDDPAIYLVACPALQPAEHLRQYFN